MSVDGSSPVDGLTYPVDGSPSVDGLWMFVDGLSPLVDSLSLESRRLAGMPFEPVIHLAIRIENPSPVLTACSYLLAIATSSFSLSAYTLSDNNETTQLTDVTHHEFCEVRLTLLPHLPLNFFSGQLHGFQFALLLLLNFSRDSRSFFCLPSNCDASSAR